MEYLRYVATLLQGDGCLCKGGISDKNISPHPHPALATLLFVNRGLLNKEKTYSLL